MANRVMCETCNKTIGKSAYKLQCGTCKKWFHTKCSNVSEVDARLFYERKTAWFCHDCVEERTSVRKSISSSAANLTPTIGTAIDQETETLKDLIRDLKEEMSTLRQSMDYMNNLFENERSRNKILADIVEEVKCENENLKKELHHIKNVVNNFEYQKIRNNLVISGVCENINEKQDEVKTKVLSVLKTIDKSFTDRDITTIKISKSKGGLPLIITTLVNEEKKSEILRKRAEVGKLNGEKCNLKNVKNIFVNEELTPSAYRLLKEAKELRRMGYQYVWTKNGSIYARRKNGENAVRIRDESHLNEIIELTQNS